MAGSQLGVDVAACLHFFLNVVFLGPRHDRLDGFDICRRRNAAIGAHVIER